MVLINLEPILGICVSSTIYPLYVGEPPPRKTLHGSRSLARRPRGHSSRTCCLRVATMLGDNSFASLSVSLVNVNCECYPQGNSRSRKTSLSLTRHRLSRVEGDGERNSGGEEREMVDGGGRQSEEASVILLPSRALTLAVRPGPAQLLVESFTTGAAPVDVVRSPTDSSSLSSSRAIRASSPFHCIASWAVDFL